MKSIGGLPTALFFQCGIVFSCGIYIFMTQNICYQIDIPEEELREAVEKLGYKVTSIDVM